MHSIQKAKYIFFQAKIQFTVPSERIHGCGVTNLKKFIQEREMCGIFCNNVFTPEHAFVYI